MNTAPIVSKVWSLHHPARRRRRLWRLSGTTHLPDLSQHGPEGRWRSYGYEDLKARDKTSLDIFRLKDKSLTDLDNLPEPDDLAEEIIENLEAGLNSFRDVLAGLRQSSR